MLTRKSFLAGAAAAVAAPLSPIGPARAVGRTLRLGGTGATLGLQQKLGLAYRAQQPECGIEVLPSLGSAGGIRALAAGALDIAFSGRGLTAEEQRLNVIARPLLRTPVVLVTSHPTIADMTVQQMADIFANRQQRWPDGQPVRIVLRPKSESAFVSLAEAFPDIGRAIDLARERTEIPVATTDQDNFALAEQMEGSLAIALLTQVTAESTRLRPLALGGIEASVANLRAGTYPCSCDLFIVVRRDQEDEVADLARFITGRDGERVITQFGGWPLSI